MIIGIDLGTTHSLVSVWQDGHAVLIPNALGETLTPSAVSLGDGDTVLVGRGARRPLAHPARNWRGGLQAAHGKQPGVALGKLPVARRAVGAGAQVAQG